MKNVINLEVENYKILINIEVMIFIQREKCDLEGVC